MSINKTVLCMHCTERIWQDEDSGKWKGLLYGATHCAGIPQLEHRPMPEISKRERAES
jgi:hypothetical protein